MTQTGVPRQQRSLGIRILHGIYATLVLLTITTPYLCLIILIYFVVWILVLPYTLLYYSPNFGMGGKDSAVMQVYIDAVQKHHRIMDLVRNYSSSGAKPRDIAFYPHKEDTSWCCIPGAMYVSHTEHNFSTLAGFLSCLETAGWPRRAIYDFLHMLVKQSSVHPSEDFIKISKKMTSHNLLSVMRFLLRPSLTHPIVKMFLGPKIQMWNGTGMEVVVTYNDLGWLVNKGAVIKPLNENVLFSIETLNKHLGGSMWKFASAPSDVNGNQWQTVVGPKDSN